MPISASSVFFYCREILFLLSGFFISSFYNIIQFTDTRTFFWLHLLYILCSAIVDFFGSNVRCLVAWVIVTHGNLNGAAGWLTGADRHQSLSTDCHFTIGYLSVLLDSSSVMAYAFMWFHLLYPVWQLRCFHERHVLS